MQLYLVQNTEHKSERVTDFQNFPSINEVLKADQMPSGVFQEVERESTLQCQHQQEFMTHRDQKFVNNNH